MVKYDKEHSQLTQQVGAAILLGAISERTGDVSPSGEGQRLCPLGMPYSSTLTARRTGWGGDHQGTSCMRARREGLGL